MTTCEDEYVQRATHGDGEAFRHLWDTHHAVAMAAALRLCHRRALAEEITQGTFLLAWRGLPRFQIGSPFRSGSYLRRFWQRVRLSLAGDDELLVVQNKTKVAWYVYHNYHQLGIVDADEQREFHLVKHGELSVRPVLDGEEVEYLVLPLSIRVNRVRIYRRQVGKEIEVYDMRIA